MAKIRLAEDGAKVTVHVEAEAFYLRGSTDPDEWRRWAREVERVLEIHLSAHPTVNASIGGTFVPITERCEFCKREWEEVTEDWAEADNPVGLPVCCGKAQDEWWEANPEAKQTMDAVVKPAAGRSP